MAAFAAAFLIACIGVGHDGDVVAHHPGRSPCWSSSRWSAASSARAGPRPASCRPPTTRDLSGAQASAGRLDRLHVVVGQAEMVADLVDEDVGDEVPEGLVVLGPVVEQRPAVEPDLVRHLPGRRLAGLREADPAEQAEEIELGSRTPSRRASRRRENPRRGSTRPAQRFRKARGRLAKAACARSSIAREVRRPSRRQSGGSPLIASSGRTRCAQEAGEIAGDVVDMRLAHRLLLEGLAERIEGRRDHQHRGHADVVRHDEVAGDVLEQGRPARVDPVALQEALVGGALGLGDEIGVGDVEHVLEMVEDAELGAPRSRRAGASRW